MKDSFIIYTKINEVLKELTDDQKGKLFQAIIDYEMTGEIPAIDDALVKVSFIPVRQDLDVNNEKWEETVKARQEAGRKGGLAKASKAKNSRSKTSKAKNATNKEKQNVANVAVYDNEYVNDCDYEYDNVNDSNIPPISPQGEKRKTAVSIIESRNLTKEVEDIVKDWVAYKTERREGYKPRGLNAFITEVQKNANEYGEDEVIRVINKSMSSNYQGVVWDWLSKEQGRGGFVNSPDKKAQIDIWSRS